MRHPAPVSPKLDPEVVADDEKLGAVLGEVADHDVEYRTASRQIVRLQRRLRKLVGENAWQTYLALETAVNDRDADFDECLVRWAFMAGQKHPATARDATLADLPSGQR